MENRFDKWKILFRGVATVLCMYLLVFTIGGTVEDSVIIEDGEVPLSSWSAEDVYYRYDGDGYCYVITTDGRESFSFVNEDGTILEALSGGGTYMMIDGVSWQYTCASFVNGFVDNGDGSVTVSYMMSDGSSAYNVYRFHEDSVEVQASVSGITNSTTVAGAVLARNCPAGYSSVEKKIASHWVYPENGDFPYLEQEGIVTALTVGDHHKVYTFVRGTDGEKMVLFEEYPDVHIPITISGGALSEYTITYDLVFENLNQTSNADGDALFKSRGYEFSACVSEQTSRQSAATIYFGDVVDLGIDVACLGGKEAAVQVSYQLYDYDGNVVLSADREVAIQAGKPATVPVHLETSRRGIFFLDYTVKGENDSHRELYTFALLDDYAYSSGGSFGVSGVRFGQYEANDTTAWILKNIGAGNVRVCLSEPDYLSNDYSLLSTYLERLTSNGIRVNGQYLLMDGWVAPTAGTAAAYENEINNAMAQIGKYLSDCQIGNEYNLSYSGGSVANGVSEYVANYFDAGYRSVKNTFGINVGGAGIGLSHVNWMEQSVEAGLFDKQDVFVTHAYGFPHSPDYTQDPGVELVVESSYIRTKAFLEQSGDKTWYVGEVGYPTTALETAGVSSGVDLRSQADYTIRECVLALNYGAEVVEVYNLYDQQNLFKGISAKDQEDNFGLFYDQDYYGRIMPKPSAIAFANMTRALDGTVACQEISTDSDTARVFTAESSQEGKTVYVAWSNVARLSNDIGYDFVRTPNLPWNDQWKAEEQVVFSVNGSQATVIDSMGNRTALLVENGQITVGLTGSPVYIEVTGEAGAETVSAGDTVSSGESLHP
ncbi:MAG: hypothetical protein IJZ82_05250 [Lachnospiraceae bacterium]|nr:hypothetical protein [Lachnospiraceae bacterium]